MFFLQWDSLLSYSVSYFVQITNALHLKFLFLLHCQRCLHHFYSSPHPHPPQFHHLQGTCMFSIQSSTRNSIWINIFCNWQGHTHATLWLASCTSGTWLYTGRSRTFSILLHRLSSPKKNKYDKKTKRNVKENPEKAIRPKKTAESFTHIWGRRKNCSC